MKYTFFFLVLILLLTGISFQSKIHKSKGKKSSKISESSEEQMHIKSQSIESIGEESLKRDFDTRGCVGRYC